MAYQNVGTPRFYINVVEWEDYNDVETLPSNHFRTLPVSPTAFEEDGTNIATPLANPFCFILGHSGLDSIGFSGAEKTGILINEDAQYDGWSLFELDAQPNYTLTASGNIGSIVIGTYYDMPHSPDLNLAMTREYGGIKTIETKGGASLSNAFYTKPPAWGNLGAWEIGDYPESVKLGASGRRTWDLSFSYLDDGDVFGSNQHTGMSVWANEVTATDYESDDIDVNTGSYNKNIISDDNFYSQVIHKTNGGQLPFIFQPNKDDNTNFAICKFDMNSFQFSQVANSVYNVKLKIREVW